MRVGIIGTGKHGSRYANHIVHDIDGLSLVAISRRSDEGRRQAEEWNAVWHRQWRDLVADARVEAVIAVTVPSLNLEIAGSCIAAGKPLLVEKPLAVDGSGAAEIVTLFSKAGLGLTVGQTLRYNGVIQGLCREIHRIGPLCTFSANQRLEPSTLEWHEKPELAGAGVSFHTAVHVFDALRHITGREIKRLTAVTSRRHNRRLEDIVLVLVEMEGGVLGSVDCSKTGHARSGRFEFVGEQGQLHGDQIHDFLELVRGTERTVLAHDPPGNTIMPLLADWRDFLAGKAENPVPGPEGLAAVRICEACIRSARSGSWVDIVG